MQCDRVYCYYCYQDMCTKALRNEDGKRTGNKRTETNDAITKEDDEDEFKNIFEDIDPKAFE
jgi:hypothetical protein